MRTRHEARNRRWRRTVERYGVGDRCLLACKVRLQMREVGALHHVGEYRGKVRAGDCSTGEGASQKLTNLCLLGEV